MHWFRQTYYNTFLVWVPNVESSIASIWDFSTKAEWNVSHSLCAAHWENMSYVLILKLLSLSLRNNSAMFILQNDSSIESIWRQIQFLRPCESCSLLRSGRYSIKLQIKWIVRSNCSKIVRPGYFSSIYGILHVLSQCKIRYFTLKLSPEFWPIRLADWPIIGRFMGRSIDICLW